MLRAGSIQTPLRCGDKWETSPSQLPPASYWFNIGMNVNNLGDFIIFSWTVSDDGDANLPVIGRLCGSRLRCCRMRLPALRQLRTSRGVAHSHASSRLD